MWCAAALAGGACAVLARRRRAGNDAVHIVSETPPRGSPPPPSFPKLPLPEQTLTRPVPTILAQLQRPFIKITSNLAVDHAEAVREKTSVTRSPSLENDKTPVGTTCFFGFEREIVTNVDMSGSEESPGNLRRYRSISTRLNICSEVSASESSEQSPKSDRDKLASSLTSPKFFTPPETVSPAFFQEPSPKSVYYDSVRSPKFFAESPRIENDLPQSPRAVLDYHNRNNGHTEKPNSPRILNRPSPKIYTFNKENYFTFDHIPEDEVKSPKPRRYLGRNSIERERFTPPADKDVRKYRRHNSCDANHRNVDIVETKKDENKTDTDVVDCCVKIQSIDLDPDKTELLTAPSSAQIRRQRLKSISLDSDNAKIIEQNLGLPIAKQMKDQLNEAYKNDVSTSCESVERQATGAFSFDVIETNEQGDTTDVKKKGFRQCCETQSFVDMPRFSPKEFEVIITTDEGTTMTIDANKKKSNKNLRNLTIDLTKRDSELEKELIEFEKLYTDAEEKKVKTPTLKVKATSLDSSETVNLSLPQKTTLEVPQNSISVPNTPKRQMKRLLGQKCPGRVFAAGQCEQRRVMLKGQDSGIFLRENHANLMLYQPSNSRARTMGSFDENILETSDECRYLDPNNLCCKQNLSVSSTNLKTLPEGVPSVDFEPSVEDEKYVKKLHRRNSNQMLSVDGKYSSHSSNCSLNSGASCHNLSSVRTSSSNYNLSDNRKVASLDRRDSTVVSSAELKAPTTKVICASSTNLTDSQAQKKNCLLQRRGSNNSLTLNIANSLSRHSSNSSLNKDQKLSQKKGLLERRSSNTSLTLNINTSNPQVSVNRSLSISNYNLNGSTCNLSRYNSNQSIDNSSEHKKGILERRSSNTSLTLNLSQEPRDIDIDETSIQANLKEMPKHRKSLSTENLIPKSYKNRSRTSEKNGAFGSHDNLWSNSYAEGDYSQNLTYVCGDQENEIIYAVARNDEPNLGSNFVRNITTRPLSPQTTSNEFRLYLANMQHLQNASSVLSRQELKDLNEVFQNGYSKVKCHKSSDGQLCCSNRVDADLQLNPQMEIPDLVSSQPCSEYQKTLLRNLHQEFWDMPTNFQEKPIVSGSNQKNRYKTILPNEHSRFILEADSGTNIEGYINANYIKGHEYTKNSFIATQGPLQNTIYDFWLMVYQNNSKYKTRGDNPIPCPPETTIGVQKVVMLTNFFENNRQKCEKYFPLEFSEELSFENDRFDGSTELQEHKNQFVIKNSGVITKPGYTIRQLDISYITSDFSDHIKVYHYWFHNWADHKCPKDVDALLNLSLDVLNDKEYNFTERSVASDLSEKFSKSVLCDENLTILPPPIVHCSAGIGRTGCLLAILNGIRQLMYEKKVDVLGIVCNMRLNRGGMVQNSEQYELIHKVLCLFERACLPPEL